MYEDWAEGRAGWWMGCQNTHSGLHSVLSALNISTLSVVEILD